ncbi:hypothetical protein JI664_00900 [Rhodobacter sp. NTK016B]|uniref:DUF6455 family protein n=1 Tax=Rhodobacter sp. NTK016B TaxID=2759676 RepID=UPI001A8F951C|nr:DUF6455 family protein [Rhodobacter sp. NTK016B]MBN8290511.1 hypothetical protein [Rhodobacter sp. NTK016B]
MGFFKKLDTHSDLIASMAETVHADLTDALVYGRVTGQEIRNAVMSCMGCEGSGDCQNWMDAHNHDADTPPAYCRNRAMLERAKEA